MESGKSTFTVSVCEDEEAGTPALVQGRRTSSAYRVRLDFPPFTARQSWISKSIAQQLRNGVLVDDESFDRVFPEAVQHASEIHWTPVEVAFRAACLLAPTRTARVLDIGAGAGKFCLVAAAATGANIQGIERNPYLASVAREAARRMGVAIDVRDGGFESEDPSTFDGIYLFNPFTESLCIPGVVAAFERDARQSRTDVRRAARFLEEAKVGARVATFCGFGAPMPTNYELLAREQRGGGTLEVWSKLDTAQQ